MKKTFLTLIIAILLTNLYGQQDLVIGTSYQLSLQRQNIHGDAWILHNAEFSQDVDLLKWKNTHSSYGSRGIRFTYSAGGGIYFYANNTPTTAGSVFSPTTRLFIGNNGKIGIGTSTPNTSSLVDINGDAVGAGNLWAAYIHNGWGEGKGLKIKGAASNSSPLLQIEDNPGNIRMVVQSDGRVGIGTDKPCYKLDVYGTIRTDEVIVNLTHSCDFVFKSDYKLLNLRLLEDFIKTNQHLPEIASEKEMVENGVNMKDLQMKLLQKMEEMTLYIIEQNKKLEEQNEKIGTIEEQNKLLKQEIELLKTK